MALLRAPWQFVSASGRGTVLAVRAWRRWVTVHDYREAAEQSEKLADKYIEIRELTLLRWRVTGAVAGTGTADVAVADMLYGHAVLWVTAVIGAAVLAITGRRKDGSPGRRAVLAGSRSLSWTMDPQILVDAFRDAKLIGKDETLRPVERASRVGEGWAITIDLPATRKATDVIKNREALASALAVDEVQLLVERVRGNGGHAGWGRNVGGRLRPLRHATYAYAVASGGRLDAHQQGAPVDAHPQRPHFTHRIAIELGQL